MFIQYEPEFWYWEVVEMCKKVCLTGGLIVVAKGSSAQLLVGEVICASYLLLVVRTLPYVSDADDLLQSVASICLLFTLMMAFALKTDSLKDPEYDRASMGVLLTIVNVMVLVMAFACMCVIMRPVIQALQRRVRMRCKGKVDGGDDEEGEMVIVDERSEEETDKALSGDGKEKKKEGGGGTKLNRRREKRAKAKQAKQSNGSRRTSAGGGRGPTGGRKASGRPSTKVKPIGGGRSRSTSGGGRGRGGGSSRASGKGRQQSARRGSGGRR